MLQVLPYLSAGSTLADVLAVMCARGNVKCAEARSPATLQASRGDAGATWLVPEACICQGFA